MQAVADLHPIVIHFPIVFLVVYSALSIISFFIKNRLFDFYLLLILVAGIVSAIIAVLTGNLAYQNLLELGLLSEIHKSIIEKHEYYATITLWYFLLIVIIHFYFYIKKKKEIIWRILFIIFGIVGFIIIFKTAEYGGSLVYNYGIGTEMFK